MYQFIHIETYARKASTKVKPSKPKTEKQAAAARSAGAGGGAKGMDAYVGTIQTPKTRATVSDVVGEALRDPEHCPHVENPEPPFFLVGDEATLRGLPNEIERNLAAYHAKNGGRKVRSDAHVLLAGVASYPRELERNDPAAYDRWEKSTVKWLREKYGDNLRCVLRHGNDEAHPHIHFYVCSRELVNAKDLHDGYKGAAVAIAEHGQLSKQAKAAFNDCMRDFQSDYYKHVGHAAGLLRDGPKRLRETRIVYKAREREALERVALDSAVDNARVQLLDGASLESKTAADLRRQVEREAGAMAVERVELNQLRESIQRERAGLDSEWSRAREAKTEIKTERDAAKAANSEAKARLAHAKLREQDAINAHAHACEERRFFEKMVPSWHEFRAVQNILQKFGSRTLALLNFVHKNPKVAEVLEFARQDPAMFETVRASVTIAKALGPGETPADTTDYGINRSAAKLFAGFVEEQWPNGDGLGP